MEGDRVVTHDSFAYLRISEGCDNRCAYCAIPGIRGNLRSRPMENILEEAKTLSEMGIREIVIVAQDTTMYGKDLYGKLALPELLEKLGHGVTEIRVTGMYSHTDKYMLVCIIRKKQVGEMMKIIKKYKGTFASFTKVNEVFGRFKQ